MFEYTSQKTYSFSDTNQLISNLKKSPKSSTLEIGHKRRAIRDCSEAISRGLAPELLAGSTFVPIPPSKAGGDPEYDDRMLQVCKGITGPTTIDVRELVTQNASIRTAHLSPEGRPRIDEIYANYSIDEAITSPVPKHICIVDDVLAAGAHFKAMQRILDDRFPDVRIVGIFIARRIFPDKDVNSQ